VRAKTAGGNTLEIHLDKPSGPLLGRVKISKVNDWTVMSVAVKKIPGGVHNIVVSQTGADMVEVDWVKFR